MQRPHIDDLSLLIKEKRRSQRTITRYRAEGPPKKLAELLASDVGRRLVRTWLENAERRAQMPHTEAAA